jgi:hypothetical protein
MDQEDTKLAWTALSVHLLQREQWQCDEAYLDAHECTLTSAQSPQLQSSQATQRSHSLAAYLQRPHQSHSLLSGQSGLQKVASSNCLLDGQKIGTSWAALDITTRTSCPSIAASATGTLCFQHCCQRKRLTSNAALNCHHARCLP